MYDFNGNQISSPGSGSGSGTGVDMFDSVLVENGAVRNLANPAAFVTGRFGGGYDVNSAYNTFRTTEYIPVTAGQPYVAQYKSTKGNDGYDKLALFDANKNGLKFATTARNTALGVRWATVTPEHDGYIRFSFDYSADMQVMVFKGSAPQAYVAYGGSSGTEEYEYHISADFKRMIQRDVEPSNIFGKNVYMFGDSNSDNWANGVAKNLEIRYGCTVHGIGRYGATWGDGNGTSSTQESTAIGQYNKLVSTIGIDASTKLFPADAVILCMMGTNTASGGVGTINDTGVTTDLGAANYVLKRLRYHGRANAIGVFLPWACSSAKRDGLIQLCERYKIPYFDIPSIICDDQPTTELAAQNYITDGGNHLAEHGWKAFVRIAHPWIAHGI